MTKIKGKWKVVRPKVRAGAVQPLVVKYPHAAGVDIGSRSHFVAVPPGSAEETVREFGCMTDDLGALADWLKKCGVDIVAMESTGVYWIPLYEELERRGFTVKLVSARHIKNVSGRKSDVLDCQWIQQLMSFGLLQGAFRPPESICALRAMVRQRGMHLRDQGRHVQHMQKALTQMNIQLSTVISDVAGVTGQKIVRAIVAGERDPKQLAALRGGRIRASEGDIARSLRGFWRAEHLFALKQSLSAYDFVHGQLRECDTEIEKQLKALGITDDFPKKARRRGRAKNAPLFDARERLYQAAGVDLTRIDGIDVTTAMIIISEVGTDLSRFPTASHFASWLDLCPGTKITGGVVLSGQTRRINTRAARALKMAASNLRKSQSALGAYFRRMCARMDAPKAITAAAHKLARLVYHMITKGEEYVDQGQEHADRRFHENAIRQLQHKASKLGLQLIPAQQMG